MSDAREAVRGTITVVGTGLGGRPSRSWVRGKGSWCACWPAPKRKPHASPPSARTSASCQGTSSRRASRPQPTPVPR